MFFCPDVALWFVLLKYPYRNLSVNEFETYEEAAALLSGNASRSVWEEKPCPETLTKILALLAR